MPCERGVALFRINRNSAAAFLAGSMLSHRVKRDEQANDEI
jgi:hypothetical protein